MVVDANLVLSFLTCMCECLRGSCRASCKAFYLEDADMLGLTLVFYFPFTSFHSQMLLHVPHCIHNWDDSICQEGSHDMQIKLHDNEPKCLHWSQLRCNWLNSKASTREVKNFSVVFHYGSSHYHFWGAVWTMNRSALNLTFGYMSLNIVVLSSI